MPELPTELDVPASIRVKIKSGEGEIRTPGVFVTSLFPALTLQTMAAWLFASLCLILVGVGYFRSFGNRISTKSAHHQFATAAIATGLTEQRRTARRRRRMASQGVGPESPSNTAIAASYSRFSSSQQRDESIKQQQVAARRAAASNGHELPDHLQFADEAVSGTKLQRDGLQRMLSAAEAGEFSVLYFYSVSRLARESVITMPILKRLVHTHRIRVISVTESLDSSGPSWEVLATVLSLVSETFIKELSASVLRGQEDALQQGYSVGDWCFGYRSEPVEGTETGRRRNGKPRKKYVVHQEEAEWVRKIFHWFAEERRSITWIVRELNRHRVPKDRRATTPNWHHTLVVGILTRMKYIGIWHWGENRNVRDPETGKVHQELRPETETESWIRHLPELRIVDLETFQKAQMLLAENEQRYARRTANGQLNGSRAGSEGRRPRHLLSGIIQCGECGRRFVVGGNSSKYLFCPNYRSGVCNCKTKLPRQLAEQLILDAIGEQILASPEWTNAVVNATNHAWMNRDQDIPRQLECVRSRIQEVNRRCERLLDQIEAGEVVDQLTRRFKQREKELQELRNQEAALTREVSESGEPPSEPWIRQRIADLGTTLRSKTPAAAEALRQLLVDSIVVNEVKREGRERHFLRATLSIRHKVIAQESSFAESTDEEFAPPSTVVTIDIVCPPDNRKGDEVRRLYDQGLPNKIIAEQLKISRASVTVLLKKSFDASGEEKPDGRKRRWALEGNWTTPPLFQRIADKVMGFYNEGMLLADIATKCEVDRNTVTKAIKFWNNTRELVVPDGRTRRKSLEAKQRHSVDETHPME